MLAIYQQKVYLTGDDLNQCLLLDYATGHEVMRVDYGSPTLIVDPTDDQVEAAQQGRPIPPENCAICHQHPHHEHEWRHWTPDGYGVCADCAATEEE